MRLNKKYQRAVQKAACVSAMILFAVSAAGGQEKRTDDNSRIDVLRANVDEEGIATGSIIRESDMLSYCINISDVASEARNSILKKKLKVIETDVDSKLVELDDKIKELKMWSKKRDAFLKTVNNSLVKIFESMRPDAAALQFTEIGPLLASALIMKLDPKISSAILTEMSPEDAAKVAIVLASALEVDNAKSK